MSSIGKVIKLRSEDGEIFEVQAEVMMQSQTLKNLIDVVENVEADVPIPVMNVTGRTLSKVIEYCRKHSSVGDQSDTNEIKEWNAKFVDVGQNTLFELLLAANYLSIPGLLEVTCQAVADIIKGKSPEQIRKHFNIKNDFTPEEEEEIRRDNSWFADQ